MRTISSSPAAGFHRKPERQNKLSRHVYGYGFIMMQVLSMPLHKNAPRTPREAGSGRFCDFSVLSRKNANCLVALFIVALFPAWFLILLALFVRNLVRLLSFRLLVRVVGLVLHFNLQYLGVCAEKTTAGSYEFA